MKSATGTTDARHRPGERPLYVVDAFAARPFSGNPAAVCLLDDPAPDDWMRAVAAEMRHSETAFVGPDAGGVRELRWFTPEVEVDLCGHATLAAAHVLWETGRADEGAPISFATRSGLLTAGPDPDGVALDVPATPPRACDAPRGLADALGAAPRGVARTPFDLLARFDAPSDVAGLTPDVAALRRIDARGVICTAPGGAGGADFTSRFFAPGVGIDEDPVTGSAHCALGPYWAERLGRASLTGHQASERGGAVRVRVLDGRVELVGRAVTVVAGTLRGWA